MKWQHTAAFTTITIALSGCNGDAAEQTTSVEEQVVDQASEPAQRQIPVSEMTSEQLQERYFEDLAELEKKFPDNGNLNDALRVALEAKKLESVKEMERRSEVSQKASLDRQRVEQAEYAQQNRVDNERLRKEAAEREQQTTLDINQNLEAAQAEGRARQAEDIRLLEENRKNN